MPPYIYTDRISGKATKRPELDECLADLKAGDILTVWKLDRLGRSLFHLVALLEDFEKRGVGFRSLTEAIDTGTASGRLPDGDYYVTCGVCDWSSHPSGA